MSAVDIASGMMDSVPHYDETSCGPFCAHPECWASNRRVERGLPRVKESTSKAHHDSDDEGRTHAVTMTKPYVLLV